MSERNGFIASFVASARQSSEQRERERKELERAREREARNRQRSEREQERRRAADERARKQRHMQSCLDEVEHLNATLEAEVERLESVLSSTLTRDHPLSADDLKVALPDAQFDDGDLAIALVPPSRPRRSLSELVLPWRRAAFTKLRIEHESHVALYETEERERTSRLARARDRFDASRHEQLAQALDQHREVEQILAGLRSGDLSSIGSYCRLLLVHNSLEHNLDVHVKTSYSSASRALSVEYTLPGLQIVPEVRSYRYVRSKDEVLAIRRPTSERRALYGSLVAQLVLCALYEVFSADHEGHIEVVSFNGHVDTFDRATGAPAFPCLVTLRVTRESFEQIDLERVDPMACLAALGAGISRNPAEMVPVRPLTRFSMDDPRFVTETDVLASLDQRPNLLDLSPSEFESLITNLFGRMGLETRLTQASRDGGVDCIAYNLDPVLGGKVVIQAKRYRETVGVSAVRDLYGTMQNEGASKGILVTTSGYGPAAYEFARNKPLELFEGSHLLHLLAEHAGIDAKIVRTDID